MADFHYGMKELSDVVILYKENKYHVHKYALAIKSLYFKTLFTASKDCNEVRLDNEFGPVVEQKTMELFFGTFYEDDADLSMQNKEIILELIQLASQYHCASLLKEFDEIMFYLYLNRNANWIIPIACTTRYELSTTRKRVIKDLSIKGSVDKSIAVQLDTLSRSDLSLVFNDLLHENNNRYLILEKIIASTQYNAPKQIGEITNAFHNGLI